LLVIVLSSFVVACGGNGGGSGNGEAGSCPSTVRFLV
jgi:hypothetical protein